MFKSIKNNLPLIPFIVIAGLLLFPIWSHFEQKEQINDIRIGDKGDVLVGASTTFSQNASIQLNFEVLGTYASVSGNLSFNGEIMPDGATCSNNQILKRTGANDWDCATDASGGGGIEVRENNATTTAFQDTTVASLSFNDGAFNVTASGTTDVTIKLDWVNGPASLSEADTITGNWVNTAFPWADNEVADAISLIGGTIGANSISGTQTTTDTLTIGDNGDSIIFDASNWDISTLGKADFLSASVSTNFEATGYASASKYFGSAFGSSADCNDAGDAFGWDSATGLFSCRTLGVADTSATGGTGIDISTNDFVFDATELEALTWGAGGNATNTWTFNLSSGDPTMIWAQSGASFSGDFEVDGTASSSYDGSLNIAKSVNAGTYNGASLQTCNATTGKLTWSAGKFGCGSDQTGTFDSTAIDNTTWSDSVNATNVWTFDVSGTDHTLTFGSNYSLFSGGVSTSLNFEAVGYASASSYFGSAFGQPNIDCNDDTDKLMWSGGLFSCGTLADADIPDTISLIGGTIGANNISGTQTTTGTLTFGDNGDIINFDSSTWDITSGAVVGFTTLTLDTATTGVLLDTDGDGMLIIQGQSAGEDEDLRFNLDDFTNRVQVTSATAVDTIQFSSINVSTSFNFEATGYASASAYYGGQVLWRTTVASTSTEWFSGGRLPLPRLFSNKYILRQILCSVDVAGSTIAINVSNKTGTYDSEAVTCDGDANGASDTSIDTNPNYTTFTTASSSLEIGAISGDIDYLDFTIIGILRQ